jgi:glucose/mannose-6-phosphate isomerase
MRSQILQFPKQLSEGVKLAQDIKIDKTYEKVIICGMGGSIIAGEMLLFWQEITGMSPMFYIHRDYDLPPWVSKNDLVVCISWSGNTEETLSCYEAAVKSDIPVVDITTGGKLAELSKKHKTPLVLIPDKNLAPRMGVGYMVAALFQLMGLGRTISKISLDADKTEIKGKKLAEKINEKSTPLLYSSYKWRILPRLWKVLFNENDKIHAFWNCFPAMAHNELAGFDKELRTKFYPILFKDAGDDPRQNKNIDTAVAILDKIGYNCSIISISSSDNPLKTVLNSYVLGLWTTYYLAKKIGVDPEKIELIEDYKKLKSK